MDACSVLCDISVEDLIKMFPMCFRNYGEFSSSLSATHINKKQKCTWLGSPSATRKKGSFCSVKSWPTQSSPISSSNVVADCCIGTK